MLTFSAQQIAMMIQGKVEGDAAVAVTQFGKIEEAKVGELTFLANPKYEEFLYQTKASIVIINETQVLKTYITNKIPGIKNPKFIGHSNPLLYFPICNIR